jgi:hypothetical protein
VFNPNGQFYNQRHLQNYPMLNLYLRQSISLCLSFSLFSLFPALDLLDLI